VCVGNPPCIQNITWEPCVNTRMASGLLLRALHFNTCIARTAASQPLHGGAVNILNHQRGVTLRLQLPLCSCNLTAPAEGAC
jgi:hypothetical protein